MLVKDSRDLQKVKNVVQTKKTEWIMKVSMIEKIKNLLTFPMIQAVFLFKLYPPVEETHSLHSTESITIDLLLMHSITSEKPEA